jgi:hypothetical protein
VPEHRATAAYFESLTEAFVLSPENRQILHNALTILDDCQYTLKGQSPGTALPDTLISQGPPQPLLQALANVEIAQVLEFALGLAPSSHWALVGMLGTVLKPAQDRQPVGPGLLRVIAKDTDASRW